MATKAQLLAEIQAMYEIVGTPFEVGSSDEHIPEQINSYSVIVYESGLSEVNKKPILSSKYINFIVYNEYQPEETAYYVQEEPTNNVNSDITADGSLESINKIFQSESIRGKVQAAIAKSANSVLLENNPRATMLSDTAAGQKAMLVDEPRLFWQGKEVRIRESGAINEIAIIDTVDITTGIITFVNDLVYSYTTAGVTRVTFTNNVERRQWAVNALLSPVMYVLSMTSLVSLDPTVQAAGGLVTDTVLENIVDSYISLIASASYL
jgi:hypothetical protein